MINIDKLEAGRELDSWVAELVMGEDPVNCWIGDGQTKRPRDLVPHYSTEISAAWKIIGHMMLRPEFADKDFGWSLRSEPNSIGAHFGKAFHQPDPWPGSYWTKNNETIEFAICVAALKAVGAAQ